MGSTLVLGRDAGGSGVPPARRQQGRVESRHALLRSAYRVMAECRRSATMSADVGGDALLRERGGDGPQRGRDDRCATTGETGWSAGRTRFQLTPDSASGDRVEREICTARRCRCRFRAGVCQRRRSAAHLHRCVYPRRCRVILRLWRSSASPMRRRLRAEAAEGSDVDWRDVTNL